MSTSFNILAISGSLRARSSNTEALRAAAIVAPEMLFKPIGLLNVSPRSVHAYTSLAETLRTMSTQLVEGASMELPLAGTKLEAAAIAATPELAKKVRGAVDALIRAAVHYRSRREELAER